MRAAAAAALSVADVSSSHAVAQFVLVADERHDAHVGLDEERLIQDQHAVGPPRDRLHDVDFLRRVLQLLAEFLDLREEDGNSGRSKVKQRQRRRALEM